MGGFFDVIVFVLILLLTFSNVYLCICRALSEVQCIPSERDALLQMKHHLLDPSNRLVSWSPHTNCCKWDYVVCHNITGHVLKLQLSSPPPNFEDDDLYETSVLGGEVHPSLLNLKHLNYLDLSVNDFGGMKIPIFLGLMTSLTYLNLSNAGFGGSIPQQIGRLSKLRYLDLGHNEFNGSVPIQFWNLSNMIYLDLEGNHLEGSIPHQIGKLSNLQYLDLSDNVFNGSIPHQLGNLSNLNDLHLGGMNEYELSISVESLQWVLTLSSLQSLELSYVNTSNAFDLLHFLHSLPSLKELHLLNCHFNHHFEPSTLNFSSLVVLDLSHSYFATSLIPNWIFQLKNLVHLQLSGNDFHGSIPDGIQNLTLLQDLDLSQNKFNSSIPNNIGNLTPLVTLDLSDNLLEGPIPISLGNLCNLKELDFSHNKWNQQISGILEILTARCVFQTLEIFYASGSQLSGHLTDQIGLFKNLVELDLSDNSIQGALPSSLGHLCNLNVLDFSHNKWNQQISGILEILTARCVSQTLEIFYASGSQLYGHLTDQIGLFKNLVELDLSENSIQGALPSSFGNLKSLIQVDLSNNSIQGALPSSLGNIKSLINLDLWKNTINNSIPISFGNLTSLMYLDLSENQLDGNPFEILGSLSKLKGLYLEYNLFEGVVKETHLVNFTQLKAFSASENQLILKVDPNWNPSFQLLEKLSLASWNVGPHFPSWIQSLKHLQYLDISNSMICHSIPSLFWGTIGNLHYLNLSHNHIEEELSNILINITVTDSAVDLSSNKLYGQLPYVSQDVGFIDLSRNKFSGSIASFLCHQQEEIKSLKILNLVSNYLSGKIPDCWMRWPYIVKVNLENNHFTGTFHTSKASLSQLKTLNLGNNNFSGNFPSFSRSGTNLISLDLRDNQFSGGVPSWIGKRLSSLKILVLKSNKFSGPIPHQICDMSALRILDFAHNKLTGKIPSCINYLSAMLVTNSSLEPSISFEYPMVKQFLVEALLLKGIAYDYSTNLGLVTSIDFSSNELSGEIPIELTRLKGLHYLNLSNNHFIGQIPQTIGNMESLESMDFSRNNLSGEIPSSMSKLSFLNKLNLSYNKLMGKIPMGTQLQSFEASSFVGNDLCGPPLNRNCSSNNSNNKEKEVHHVKGINWFFVIIGFGFIVGFWIVVGPLLFCSSWRYAYFQFFHRIWFKFQSSSY